MINKITSLDIALASLPFFGVFRKPLVEYIDQWSQRASPNPRVGYIFLCSHVVVVSALIFYILLNFTKIKRTPLWKALCIYALLIILGQWYVLGGLCIFTPFENFLIEGESFGERSAAGRLGECIGLPQCVSHTIMFVVVCFCLIAIL